MTGKHQAIIRKFCRNESGTVMIMAAFSLIAFLGMAALTIDVGYDAYVKQRLQATANAAAIAAATYIAQNCTSSSSCPAYSNATAAASSYVTANWNNALTGGNAPTMSLTGKCIAALVTQGAPCTASATANTPLYNALSLQLHATAPSFFASVLGVSSVSITANAYAAAKGSAPPPLNVILIIDTTGSMNTSDSSCSGNTRIACALQGAQVLLGELWPNQDQVGLMVFPGLKSPADAQYEYACHGGITSSMISPYYAGEGTAYTAPTYLVVGSSTAGSTDYRIQSGGNAPSAGLNASSDLALAVGAGSCSAKVQAVGGPGTYYADIITAAQTTLSAWKTINGRQNVIVMLSDGDANADDIPSHDPRNVCCETTSGAGLAPGTGQTLKINYQCAEAVSAAQAATADGTWVYSVAYGSSTSTSGSCSTDSKPVTPIGSQTYASHPTSGCATMTNIASEPAKFYSDDANGCLSAANPSLTSLNAIFKNIGNNLTYARLIPNAVFSGPAE